MSLLLYRKPGLGWRAKFITSAAAIAAGYKKIAPATWRDEGASPPAVVPPSATVTGAGAQKVTVKLAGDYPLTKGYTANVSFAIDAGTTTPFDVTIPTGSTLAQVVTKITTDTNWPAALTAATTADGFTADAGTGKVVASFAVIFT